MSNCTKALNIDVIVDEIIWLSHAGSCKNSRCQHSFSLNPERCHRQEAHLRALSQRILVCKLWAKIGIRQLWSSYTRDKNLLSLINTTHWRDRPRLKKNQSEEPEETQHEFAIDTEIVSYSQLDRWNFYAEYVRTLTIGGTFGKDYGKDYHPESFLRLSHITERPIIPSLRALVAHGSWLAKSSAPSILATILSQSVQHLEIDFPFESNPREILNIVHQHAFELRRLQLRRSHIEPYGRVFDRLLPSFASLQVLRLDPGCARGDLLTIIGLNLRQLQILDFEEGLKNDKFYSSGLPVSINLNPNRCTENFPHLDSLHLESSTGICCSLGNIISKTFGHSHPLRFLSVVHKGVFCSGKRPEKDCISHYCDAFGSAFGSLEFFRLDSRNLGVTPTLKLEVVNSIRECTRLTELSLSNFKGANNLELVRFLPCWPNLAKLEIIGPRLMDIWYTYFDALDDEEDSRGLVNTGIAKGKLEDTEGIGMDCLTTIKECLPHLQKLRLTITASPTEPLKLEQPTHPFMSLEKLEFVHSFWNFRRSRFHPEEAARFISSFMNSTTEFILREDESLEDDLPSDPEDSEERDLNIPWMEYSREYNQFCKQLQEKVDFAYDIRSDEKRRLMVFFHSELRSGQSELGNSE